MGKLRILHVTHRIYPPNLGGSSIYADRICQLHAERGHNVEAWTTLENDMPRMEWRKGYVVRRYPALFSLFDNPFAMRMLPDLVRCMKSDFDLVVAHSHLMFPSNLAFLASQLSHTPLIVISHGYAVKRNAMMNLLLSAYLTTFARAIVEKSDYVVALTSREAMHLMKLGAPSVRCVVIPSGVDTQFFRPDERAKKRGLIVSIGRFVPEKNLDCLIKAIGLLHEKRRKVELVLAGYGPEQTKLIRQASRLGGTVRFRGPLSRVDVADLLRQGTVFALPSLAEGLPMTVLEAMSSGVPVIASSGLGLEEILNGAGLFCDPGFPEQWALTIDSLLKDARLRNRLGAQGRALAVNKYDWRRIADRLEELFRLVTKSKS